MAQCWLGWPFPVLIYIARASRVCTIGLDSDLFQNSVTGISIQSNRAFIIPIYAARYRYGMCTLEYQASNVTAVFKVTTFCMDSSLSSLINRIASHRTPRCAEIQPMSQQAAAATRHRLRNDLYCVEWALNSTPTNQRNSSVSGTGARYTRSCSVPQTRQQGYADNRKH